MSLPNVNTGETPQQLVQIQEMNKEKKADLENSLLKEALAISNENCNKLIQQQNTLVADLTTQVSEIKSESDWNAQRVSDSVKNAVSEMKNLQGEARSLNQRIAAETSEAVRRTVTTLESEIRKTVQAQSAAVFEEAEKELAESKKLLESTREELRTERGFRKFLFWATPALLLVQTIVIILSLL